MYADLEDLLLEKWLRVRENGELKWKTKNGDEISIKNMSDYHLNNAINMLERAEDKMVNLEDSMID